MTFTTKEGVSFTLILALLAFLTFICGIWYGYRWAEYEGDKQFLRYIEYVGPPTRDL